MKAIAILLCGIFGLVAPVSESSETVDQVAYFDYTAFFYDADQETFYFVDYQQAPTEQLSQVTVRSYDASSGTLVVQDEIADRAVTFSLDDSIHGIGILRSAYAQSVLLHEVNGEVRMVSSYDLRNHRDLKCSCQLINSDGLNDCQSGGRGATSASLSGTDAQGEARSSSIVCGEKYYPCCN